jgi:hypothetical protein
MDQGLAQVLGAGLAAGVPPRHVVGDAVVAHQAGMVHRQVRRALLEVAVGIAPRLHQFRKQVVGPADGRAGVVDELGLCPAPAVRELGRLAAIERPQAERLHPLLARPQRGLGLALAARLVDGGDILRAEVTPQRLRAALSKEEARRDHDDQGDQGQYDKCGGVHTGSSSPALALARA